MLDLSHFYNLLKLCVRECFQPSLESWQLAVSVHADFLAVFLEIVCPHLLSKAERVSGSKLPVGLLPK